MSPWQRMKWTDSMVRLLIMAVFYIGDEACSEVSNDSAVGKKKAAGGGGGVLAQKKGKWKSVSRAMMEKGFCVSPQQCEDKFNDLNKRYKRVNDILGKGTACTVVENQSLLETMDLSPKMKEEVKKLLNSKHLFFREMCAYHNSCGHGSSSGAAATSHSPEVATDQSHAQQQQAIAQQKCSHSSEVGTNSRTEVLAGSKVVAKTGRNNEEADDEEDEDESDEEEDDYNDDDDEVWEGNSMGQRGNGHEEEDDHDEKHPRKRPRKEVLSLTSSMTRQFNLELTGVIQDGVKSPWEKKQWMRVKIMQLEEQQVSYQYQDFKLEKQRLKWVKFSSKKEREMERAKLENERQRLKNERMVLILRQKELELLDIQHQQLQQQQQNSSNKRSDPSSITG